MAAEMASGQPLSVRAVDYHTAGEPFRILTGGVPPLPGRTILEKRAYARRHLDHVRKLVVNEPRGHADMYGCFVTEPEDEGAQLGVVFFHNAGYSTACGHGTIALVTWALESGVLPAVEPVTEVVVDVPSGRLPCTALVRGARVAAVRFRNVPAFVFSPRLEVAGVECAVAFGGAFYALLPAAAVGLRVSSEHLPRLIQEGRRLKIAVESACEVVHPLQPELRGVYGVIFTEGDANVTVFADGEVDRSPCGSGTSARLAVLDAAGELARGQVLRHRSIVGTVFEGRVVGDAAVGGRPAVVTEVEGSAHLTGRHEFVLQPEDELGTGFLLR